MAQKPKPRKSSAPRQSAGGSIISGDVHIENGTFVGRDYIQQAPQVKELFKPIYQKIQDDPTLPADAKQEVHELVKEVEQEVVDNKEPNARLLTRLFKDIQKMTPDILQVISATLTNPAAGLTLVAQKVINKALQDTGA